MEHPNAKTKNTIIVECNEWGEKIERSKPTKIKETKKQKYYNFDMYSSRFHLC